jgi:quercetin dioxygenase-like cupin family protein
MSRLTRWPVDDTERTGVVTGHVGYVIEGDMEIEFDDRVEQYRAGDGLVIPAGTMDRHRPKALSERVRLVFVEDGPVDASHDR